MNSLDFIFSWIPVMAWAGVIYYLSSIPSLNSGLGVWDFILRKMAHVVEFAVLTLLLLRALERTWPQAVKKNLMVGAGLFSVLYAISDEIHQSFVPGRGPSVHDVIIDSVGVIFILMFYRRKKLWLC